MNDSKMKIETDIIETDIVGSLAVIKVKEDAFSLITEISEGYAMINWYNLIKENSSIKGVLIYGDSNLLGSVPYKKFLSNISEHNLENIDSHKLESLNVCKRKTQINMLNNITRNIFDFPKMVVTFINGCVVTPFIGVTLATDIRLATKKASFSFLHKKFGLHPTGALPFFLTANLGIAKTKNLLYTKDQIDAEELLSLGLIDEIIDPKDISEVIEHAKKLVEQNFAAFKTTKELTNKVAREQYKSFMELEEHMIL